MLDIMDDPNSEKDSILNSYNKRITDLENVLSHN